MICIFVDGVCERCGVPARTTKRTVRVCLHTEADHAEYREHLGNIQKTLDSQPGKVFARLAKSMGAADCQFCNRTAAVMNSNGVDWCEEHLAELVDQVHENSKVNASLVGAVAKYAPAIAVRAGIKRMLKKAIKESRKLEQDNG